MLTAWTKHLKDAEEKDKYTKSLLHSKWILEDLSKIVSNMERDLDRSELDTKTYELPNWDYRQAHNNGARQYLRIFQKLINLDQKENNV